MLSGKQILGAGITIGVGKEMLGQTLPATYETYRTIRKDPSIAIARALSIAPIVGASWSIDADDDVPDEWIKFIQDEIVERREWLLVKALEGGIDFGWSPFEKWYVPKIVDGVPMWTWQFKQLLQDMTYILVNPKTGEFMGFRQWSPHQIDIPKKQSLLFPFRVEGDMLYGNPLLENCRIAYNEWVKASEGAARYDNKVAGSHWIVHYPPGFSMHKGERVMNLTIAETILSSLESVSTVAVPNTVADKIEQLTKDTVDVLAWKIEIISDKGGRAVNFVPRLEYLDRLKVRGLLFPERAVFEGQHGTKAEAGVHVNLAMLHREREHRELTDIVNTDIIDPLMRVNYGEESVGKIHVVPAPLVDARREFLEEVYTQILKNPIGFDEELRRIGLDELKDRLGVPKGTEVADGDLDKEKPEEPDDE